jgi:isopropylmalate/homocitrate/citramalate synthase
MQNKLRSMWNGTNYNDREAQDLMKSTAEALKVNGSAQTQFLSSASKVIIAKDIKDMSKDELMQLTAEVLK